MTRDELETAVRDYANGVLDGRIVAGKWIKLACERFLRDLERDDLFMDWGKAADAVEFIELLPHVKGKWAKPGGENNGLIQLAPFQKWLLANIFGFYKDGRRRFRLVYLTMSRKGAKDLDIATPVLTVRGWKTMGTIEVGDVVFAEDGSPTNVIATSEVFTDNPCFEITFSDGASYVAGESHEWVVWDTNATRSPGSRGDWRTMTTRELYESGVSVGAERNFVVGGKKYSATQKRFSVGRSTTVQIVDIKPVPSRPTRCLTVDHPSHQFLIGEHLTPTHNSTLAAGIGLYAGFFEGEPGAEVYSAATTRDQARIIFDTALGMVRNSFLRERLTAHQRSIFDLKTGSKFQPLSSDASTLDGLSSHVSLIDEVHEHKSPEVFQKLETSTGARENPLIIVVTTAGYDRNTICWRLDEYAQKVLDGAVDDDTVFGAIYRIDDDDDWADESVWAKANPLMPITPSLEDLQRKCKKAKEIPAEVNSFRRLHANQWTESYSLWLPMDTWAEGSKRVPEENLRGQVCYGGLDLARSQDLSSFYLFFPETGAVLGWSFCPEEAIEQRSRRDRVPYQQWAESGKLIATPGNVVDYEFIKAKIMEVAQIYDLRELAYDRFFANKLVTELMDEGIVMVPFGMGYASMTPAVAELERLVLGRELKHGGDPVLTWAASNVVLQYDPAGNAKPSKDKSTERIDPIVALMLAVGRAAAHANAQSYFEREGELLALG